uniref:Endo/exonuclease/phosphatase domain-containing protein n=1 Tax=Angiostrongylus cantonensis TaxID=6313 RepID=A0A0K0DR76_ANGCA
LKVFQAIVAVRQLHRICENFSNSNSSDETRLIFAGDFNSTPDGPVYEILSTGLLRKSSSCWDLDPDLIADDLLARTMIMWRDIYLSLQLLPSRKGLNNLTGTGCTNHTRHTNAYGEELGFSGCLDYIWSDSAMLHRLAPRPSYELLNKYGALPSRIAPSDHVPLICEVKF